MVTVAALVRSVLFPLMLEAARIAIAEKADSESDPLVDVADVLPLSRRVAYALAREGKIAGAAKVGKTWMARRSAIVQLLEHRPSLTRTESRTPATTEPWTPALALVRAGVRSSGGAR